MRLPCMLTEREYVIAPGDDAGGPEAPPSGTTRERSLGAEYWDALSGGARLRHFETEGYVVPQPPRAPKSFAGGPGEFVLSGRIVTS